MTEETQNDTVQADADVEADVVAETAVKKTRAKKADEAKTAYEVINGAISPEGGGIESLVHPGSIVHLTHEQAKHYNALGYLKPVIKD